MKSKVSSHKLSSPAHQCRFEIIMSFATVLFKQNLSIFFTKFLFLSLFRATPNQIYLFLFLIYLWLYMFLWLCEESILSTLTLASYYILTHNRHLILAYYRRCSLACHLFLKFFSTVQHIRESFQLQHDEFGFSLTFVEGLFIYLLFW